MEVECIGNTQIIHMEETGITQQTIGLVWAYITGRFFLNTYPPPHPNLGWSDQEGSNPPLLRAPNNTRHKYWIGPKKKYARFISLFSATLKTYISGSPEARAWSPAQLHYGMREQCRVIKNCRCNVCSEIFPNILLNRICILDHKCNVWNEIQAF